MANLRVSIGGVEFNNPVFVASGTFGYGNDVSELVDVNQLGAIITKSITFHPREGNPPPRIIETPSGMLNSIGLANIGVDQFIKEMIPYYASLETKVIVNIAGSSMEEYLNVLEKVEKVGENICGYEINVSCPNVEKGGMEFGVDSLMTRNLTELLRERTEKLLILKLSPNVTDITDIAKGAKEGGADAISAINTVIGMSIDISSRKSNLATKFGGLSGPAIKPIGIANVHKLSSAIQIPVIGIGGITSAEDVVEYLLAGATAVQIGTANFRDPGIGVKIIAEVDAYCDSNGYYDMSELTGALVNDS